MKAPAAGAALLLGACAMAPPPSSPPPPDAGGCPVIGDGEWHAHINAMPSPDGSAPMLIVVGTVDLPTPGYALTLTAGPSDRMMPPSQRFRLTAVAPSGPVAQVVTRSEVRYSGRAYPPYRSLIVVCGDRALATISDIQTAY